MMQAFKEARVIQAKMSSIAADLGRNMAVPADRRDAEAIGTYWGLIDSQRPKLSSLYRTMRKLEVKPRKGLLRSEAEAQKTIQRDVKDLGKRMRLWDDMSALVARHISPEPNPLSFNVPDAGDDGLLNLFHNALFRLANPNGQSQNAEDFGCFPDIPVALPAFRDLCRVVYRLLLVQGRADTARFLDVGCGGGAKVLAASYFFPGCDGLDYDASYVDAAQRMFYLTGSTSCRAFAADGITYSNYAHYDIIYFYRPMRDDALLQKMEQQIFATAKPGALILAVYDGWLRPRDGLDAVNVMGPIFLAHGTEQDAATLLDNAMYTDTRLITRSRDKPYDVGFWEPILDAATYNAR